LIWREYQASEGQVRRPSFTEGTEGNSCFPIDQGKHQASFFYRTFRFKILTLCF
jgi:hypothetical protein